MTLAENCDPDADKCVDVAESACTVICTPSGGNLSAKRNMRLKWKLKGPTPKFKLVFHAVPVDGFVTPPVPWPFGTHPAPAEGDDSTGWITSGVFIGRIAFDEGVFEYDVYTCSEAGVAVLDPMIIVRP
jgi:hypothetical protein